MESTYSEESFMEAIGNNLYKDLSKFNILKRRDNFSKFKNEESILLLGDLNKKEPELSIVIPTYKRAEVLKDAVDSALNQRGFTDFEVIVVDNEGVWDYETNTETLMKLYNDDKLYYYKNKKNIGQRANWNRCLELARGKWICFIQNDDCLLDDCCKECMDIIHKDSKIQALSVKLNILVRNKNGHKRIALSELGQKDDIISKVIINSRFYKQLHTLGPRDYFFGKSVYAPTGIFYKKENVMKLGGFIIDPIACDDALFNEQYIMWFGMKRLDKVLALSGQGGNATSMYESGCRVVNDYYYYDQELVKKCKIPMKNIFVNEMTYEKIKLHNVQMKDIKIPFDKDYPGSWKQRVYKIIERFYGYFYLIRK